MKVSDIMTASLYTVSSDTSVAHASDLMNHWKVGSLIVMDQDKLMGIVTSRDLRSSHPNRIVADAMTVDPIGVDPEVFIWDALKIMDQYRIERLLVMNADRLAGIITREAIRMKLSEIRDTLTGLYRSDYIHAIGESHLAKRQPFHLLFIDLNQFGLINKRYGHPFGDDVIRELSGMMASLIVEERDYLCRYAGDEFVMISLADEAEIENYIQLFSQSTIIGNINISASVGHVDVSEESGLLSLPLRDIISQASLLSTSAKPVQSEC